MFDIKSFLTRGGFGKNIAGVVTALTNSNITRADIRVGGEAQPGSIGCIKTDLDLDVEIKGVACHLNIPNAVISLMEG